MFCNVEYGVEVFFPSKWQSCSLSLSLSGVCLTKRFHQAVLIEAICRGCPADVDLCLVWQVYTHKPTTLSVNRKIRSPFFLTGKTWWITIDSETWIYVLLTYLILRGLMVWPNLLLSAGLTPIPINWFNLDHAPHARIVLVSSCSRVIKRTRANCTVESTKNGGLAWFRESEWIKWVSPISTATWQSFLLTSLTFFAFIEYIWI